MKWNQQLSQEAILVVVSEDHSFSQRGSINSSDALLFTDNTTELWLFFIF